MTRLLYALILIAVQTAALAHDHAGTATLPDSASQVCEFCTGFPAGAAPPPEAAVVRHAAAELPAAPASDPAPPRSHPACAGPSRAPPAIRSV